jgi:hypothetical protein
VTAGLIGKPIAIFPSGYRTVEVAVTEHDDVNVLSRLGLTLALSPERYQRSLAKLHQRPTPCARRLYEKNAVHDSRNRVPGFREITRNYLPWSITSTVAWTAKDARNAGTAAAIASP